jgi:hypothetical protein
MHIGEYAWGLSREAAPPRVCRRSTARDACGLTALCVGDSTGEAADRALREHLSDPDTLMMPHLLFLAWGRYGFAS